MKLSSYAFMGSLACPLPMNGEGAQTESAARAKTVAFIAVMGALGNVLSWASMLAARFTPVIPLGPYNVSVALDLSHVATFIAALCGGPVTGALTGLVGGAAAAVEFGFSKGNLITGFTLPAGKALTGLSSGVLLRWMGLPRQARSKAIIALLAVIAYLPEAAFTGFIFLAVFPMVFGTQVAILVPIVATILIKAFIELAAVGTLVSGLYGNKAFNLFLAKLYPGATART